MFRQQYDYYQPYANVDFKLKQTMDQITLDPLSMAI